ncbi:conserved Plasmodium protein, unknown function [Plasmodium vivax]|nr:conserved Plasmodium protein, unknown function [Plasmodium vivax]
MEARKARPRRQRTASYGAGRSEHSSQGEHLDSYYDEARYLSKEQMKAYIHKMKKEIQEYKLREMNHKIEIKYLRRKIERLKGIIQNDHFFLSHQRGASQRSHQRGASLRSHQQGTSLRSHQRRASLRSQQSGSSFKSGMNEVHSDDGKHSGWYRRGNVSEGNYHRRGFSQKYDGVHHDRDRSGNLNRSRNRNQSRFYGDHLSEAKFSNVSMRSINASIHNNKRMNVRNFTGRYSDICRRSDYSQVVPSGKGPSANNATSGNVGRSNKLKNYVRDHPVHPFPMPMKVKNEKACEDRMGVAIRRGPDSFRSNRSCSCTSKFKLKSHLISNSNHMRNMSTDINTTIAKGIKSYYSSKQSILSGTSQQPFGRNLSSFKKRPSGRKGVEAKADSLGNHLSVEKLSKLTPREIKKKINCDLFDYAHHQRVLSKKYTSPYAFKRETRVNRVATSCGKATQRSASQGNAGEESGTGEQIDTGEQSDSGDSIKRVKLYLDQHRKKGNPPTAAPTTMPAAIPAAIPTGAKKHEGASARGRAEAVTTGAVLIPKGGKQNEENSNAKGNHTKSRDGTQLKTSETKQRQNGVASIKKSIDVDIKQNFKKELEELKRRKDILVSKRSDYCDLSFGSTSSSDGGRDRSRGGGRASDRVGDPGKGAAQCKAVNNPLKESTILNISFNDLDKRISNLKNYLKNTNG